MATRTIIAAGVLSLILVGTTGKTRAESTTDNNDASSEVVTFLGKTLCFSGAPASVTCDWRLPPLGSKTSSMHASKTSDRVLQPKVFRLLGKTFCVGAVPKATDCSVELPGSRKPGVRQARL